MTFLLAVLISGVLLDTKDMPIPNYQLIFSDANLNLIKVTTDKDGKFQVNLAPGTYRYQIEGSLQSITVDKSTSRLKLQQQQQRARDPRILVIDERQRDFSLRPDERARVIVPQ
jgi:Carboxypeptidase regulatory-like domain